MAKEKALLVVKAKGVKPQANKAKTKVVVETQVGVEDLQPGKKTTVARERRHQR